MNVDKKIKILNIVLFGYGKHIHCSFLCQLSSPIGIYSNGIRMKELWPQQRNHINSCILVHERRQKDENTKNCLI